jgi:hypothetical protein
MAADESDETNNAQPESAAADRRSGARPRPPLTIDLTAEEVPAAERRAAAEEPVPSPAEAGSTDEKDRGRPENSAHGGPGEKAGEKSAGAARANGAGTAMLVGEGLRGNLIAGVVGAIVALVVLVGLQALGVLPSAARSAAERALAEAGATADAEAGLARRVAALEATTEAVSGMQQDVKSLTDKIAGLDALRSGLASRSDLDSISANVAALTKRFDNLPVVASRDDLNALSERVGRLEAAIATGGGQAASATALTSLSSQLNQAEADVRALSDKVAALQSRPATAAGDDAVRAVAVAALRRASADGKPFAADVDLVANLGVGGSDIATIRPLATKGVATAADLAAAFPDVANAILAATTEADPNANFAERAWASLSGLVQVRPLGPVAGSDPDAIVSRMRDDVSKGDLAGALAERNGLPQAGKDASAEWAAKAADRIALDQAIGRIADAAPAKAG